MLRTAPNFSNRTNRVPAHSSRHQTSACFAGFLLKREHSSQFSCSSLVIVGKPCELITECSRDPPIKDENVWLLLQGKAIKVHLCLAYHFKTVIIESGQGKERNWAFLTVAGNQTTCCDPICTVAEVWCCSEHYLWLWVAFWWCFLVGGRDCRVLLSCCLFWGC